MVLARGDGHGIGSAWLAGVTERIALGTSVVILPYRSPIPVAKFLASVAVLSGGRLIVGVAIGWLEGEFDALGVPFKERASRTDEGWSCSARSGPRSSRR